MQLEHRCLNKVIYYKKIENEIKSASFFQQQFWQNVSWFRF